MLVKKADLAEHLNGCICGQEECAFCHTPIPFNTMMVWYKKMSCIYLTWNKIPSPFFLCHKFCGYSYCSVYTTGAAVLYQIYKHEPKASDCSFDTAQAQLL